MALATYPPDSDEQPSIAGIFGLAAHKVYLRRASPRGGVSSYLAFSPLPFRAVIFCGTSCRRLRRLPVRKYGALRCPDFPHAESLPPATIAFRAAKIQKKISIEIFFSLKCKVWSLKLPDNLKLQTPNFKLKLKRFPRFRNHDILESVVFLEIVCVFLLHLLLTMNNKHFLELFRILTLQIFRHLTIVAVSAE